VRAKVQQDREAARRGVAVPAGQRAQAGLPGRVPQEGSLPAAWSSDDGQHARLLMTEQVTDAGTLSL
jgi:hypothetical protein